MNPILSAGCLSDCSQRVDVRHGVHRVVGQAPCGRRVFRVIPIEIGGLIWGLPGPRHRGAPNGGQILAGTMMAVVAGVIIIASSLAFTTIVFPDYFNEVERTIAPRFSNRARAKRTSRLRSRPVPRAERRWHRRWADLSGRW